jgi:hypothetical protein
MLTTGDPDEAYFSQNMDSLNFMMQDTSMPKELRQRVRDYFRRSKKLIKRCSYDALIDRCLSHELRGDARYQISHDLFRQVWWLDACERSFLEDLSIYLRREAFEVNSDIRSDGRLTILVQGVASRAGTIITAGTPGGSWGDIILTSKRLRDTRLARALSYCEVAQVERAHLFKVAEMHPNSASVIREAGLRLATWRAIILISSFVRMVRARRTGRASPPLTLTNPDGLSGADGWATEDSATVLKPLHNVIFSNDDGSQPFRELNDRGEVSGAIVELDGEEAASDAATRSTTGTTGAKQESATMLVELREMREVQLEMLREQRLLREQHQRDLQSLEQRILSMEAVQRIARPVAESPAKSSPGKRGSRWMVGPVVSVDQGVDDRGNKGSDGKDGGGKDSPNLAA